ncbi:MAG: hypothetical protein B6U89_03895 [Desulfurococcales archaeon ex4484_58]|nr:MAG: hypothetical protein B6U89_03895 [Desulfurococcales archaeon ex4484_58]
MERILWRGRSLKIIRLFGEEYKKPTDSLAIIHMNIYIGSRIRNKKSLQNIINYIRMQKKYIDTIILPYMQPNGPILNIKRSDLVNKYALSNNSKYLRDLINMSRKYGINMVFPCIIEKTGSKKYLSAFFISSGSEGVVEKYRKIILNRIEEQLGFSRGKRLKSFDSGNVNFSIMIERELYFPELARVNLIRSDFLIATFPQNEPVKKYLYILRSISQTNESYTIVPGSRVYIESESSRGMYKLYYAMPTLVFNRDGDIILRYNEDEQAIIIIPWEKLKREHNRSIDEARGLYSLLNKYLRFGRRRT